MRGSAGQWPAGVPFSAPRGFPRGSGFRFSVSGKIRRDWAGFLIRVRETPGEMFSIRASLTRMKNFKEAMNVAVKEKIRIRLKSYDHRLVDLSAEKIVETAKRTGARVSGPIPLPTEREIVTILRAVHKYKDSREQFETRTHKRLIDILRPSNKTVEALTSLELPAGVEIEIKL